MRHAADQPGPEPRQEPHQPQRVEPHVAQGLEPLRPLVHAGHGLDLVADLAVARQVGGSMTILDSELLGGFSLGGEVLGFGPVIHHLRSQKGDLAANAFISHGGKCADLSPSRRRRAMECDTSGESRSVATQTKQMKRQLLPL